MYGSLNRGTITYGLHDAETIRVSTLEEYSHIRVGDDLTIVADDNEAIDALVMALLECKSRNVRKAKAREVPATTAVSPSGDTA